MSEELKAVSYCVGMSIADSLLQQELEGLSTEVLAEAINDRFLSNPPQFNSEIINRALLTVSRLKYK